MSLINTEVQDGIPISFGNDAEALEALDSGVVIVDQKHWGRLRVTGEDRLTFLHGQNTADFLALQPGSGCFTASIAICLSCHYHNHANIMQHVMLE